MGRPQSRKKTDKAGAGAAGAGANTNGTITSSEGHEHADVYHNGQHGQPCCWLLTDIAMEILPASLELDGSKDTDVSTEQETSSFFAKALRHYLLLQQQQQAAAAAASATSNTKKKRNKKKKKKKTSAATLEEEAKEGADSVSPTTATTNTNTNTATQNGNGNHHHQQQPQEQLERQHPNGGGASQDSDPSPIVATASSNANANAVPNIYSAFSSYLDRILQYETQASFLAAAAAAAENNHEGGISDNGPIPTFCQVLQHKSNAVAASTLASSKTTSTSTSTTFHIPQSDVLLAVAAIQCRSCRSEVENIVLLESRVPLPPVIHQDHQQRHGQRQQQHQQPYTGRSHVMADMHHDNDDDDDAFDYVAMEEGAGSGVPSSAASVSTKNNANGKQDNDHLVFDLVADAGALEAGWQFRQANGDPVQWTLDIMVNRLVKDYILLAGLPPDQTMGADPNILPPNLITSIQDSVDSKYEVQMTDFTVMSRELEAGVVKFADTLDHAVCNIEMMSFPVVKEVDETCCELMGRLLRIILKMTRAFQDLLIYGGSSGGGDGESSTPRSEAVKKHTWALNGIMDLWSMYTAAIDEMNIAIIDYEEQLFELATRGAITQMFLSSTSRSLYRKLVEIKIRVVVTTIHNVRVRMDRLEYLDCVGGDDWAAPFSRKLFAYDAFYKVVASLDDKKHKHIGKLPMDLASEDVLYTVREWIETVHQGTVSKIMEIHEHRREKLLRLLRACDTNLTGMVEAARDGNDASYNALSTMRQNQDLPQRFFGDGDDDGASLRMLRMELGARTLKTIRLWMGLRMHCNPDGYESERRVVMPYKLQGWVANRSGFRRSDMDVDGGFCSRGGGKTRAVCILVGLLYRWMSDRCKEWQAEVAEQELLTAVEDDNIKTAETHAAGKSTKPSKKNKKKKDKKDSPVGIPDTVNGEDTKENLAVAVDSRSVRTESRDGNIQSSLEADRHNGDANSVSEPKVAAGEVRVPGTSLDTNNGGGQEVAAHVHQLTSTVAAPDASSESKLLEVIEKEGGGAESSAGDVSPDAGENNKTVKPLTAKKQQTGVDNVDPTGKIKSHVNKKVKPSNGRKEKAKKDKPVGDSQLQSEDTHPVVTQDIDADIRVGVYHKSAYESAEDFFVKRLLAITHATTG